MYDPNLTFQQQALDRSCLVVTQPEDSSQNAWGLGGASILSTTEQRFLCYSIPQQSIIDREHGTVTTTPAQLIVHDRTGEITTANRVIFEKKTYRITNVLRGDTGDPLIKIILQEE